MINNSNINNTNKKSKEWKVLNVEFDQVSNHTKASIKKSVIAELILCAVVFAAAIGAMIFGIIKNLQERSELWIGIMCVGIFFALACVAGAINLFLRIRKEKAKVKEIQKAQEGIVY